MQHVSTPGCRASCRPDGEFGDVLTGRDDASGRGARRRRRGRAGSTAALLPTRRPFHEVRKDDPVSSRVFRLARTAGHPSEIAGSTALPGAKPSWVTVSLTVPWPTSSMSKATLERSSARQAAAVALALPPTLRAWPCHTRALNRTAPNRLICATREPCLLVTPRVQSSSVSASARWGRARGGVLAGPRRLTGPAPAMPGCPSPAGERARRLAVLDEPGEYAFMACRLPVLSDDFVPGPPRSAPGRLR